MGTKEAIGKLPEVCRKELVCYGQMIATSLMQHSLVDRIEYTNKMRGYLQALVHIGTITPWEQKLLFGWYAFHG